MPDIYIKNRKYLEVRKGELGVTNEYGFHFSPNDMLTKLTINADANDIHLLFSILHNCDYCLPSPPPSSFFVRIVPPMNLTLFIDDHFGLFPLTLQSREEVGLAIRSGSKSSKIRQIFER